MNKRTRFLAGTIAMVMTLRYSEIGLMVASAENYGSQTYQSENPVYHTMIAEDINLYYGTMYRNGIHDTDTDVSYENALKGMLNDRAEVVLTYNTYGETTAPETDLYSRSNMILNSAETKISRMTAARLGIQINGSTFVMAESGLLYSLNDSITINAGTVEISGLIYAPNGTVNINADRVKLSGLIVAENIIINAGQIEETPAGDLKTRYDSLQMEYHPEITAACLEENKIELYGGHINITEMNIYVRENNATDFKLLAETTGNEYTYTPADDVETLDIIAECTNVYEQTTYSNIVSFERTDGVLTNAVIDTDEDGIPDGYEIRNLGTEVHNPDSDGDKLPDGYEALYSHTDPLTADAQTDSDGDSLTALDEYILGTAPLYADTDFDGISDKEDAEPFTTEALADQTGIPDKKI